MAKVDYKELADRLMTSLRLETMPITVMFSSKPPEGVQKYEGVTKACTMLDVARFDGRTFYTTADNHNCRNGAFYLGIMEPFEGLLSGDANGGEGGSGLVNSPGAFQTLLDAYEIVPQGRVKYISYTPLAETPFSEKVGGLVVVFFVTPQQSLFLERGVNYKTGEPIRSLTGPATCSSIMGTPFMTGKPVATHNCFGFNLYTKVQPGEMTVGVPIHMLPEIADNIEEFQRGRPDIADVLDRGVQV